MPQIKGNIYLTQFSIAVQEQFVYFPYSIGCVWAYAEQMGSVQRSQLGGLFFVKEPIEKIILKFYNPKLVGFSNYMWNEVYNDTLAKEIKARWPECIIMYGGPQVPDKITDWHDEHAFVDICVHQEGEITFNDIALGKANVLPDGVVTQPVSITSSASRLCHAAIPLYLSINFV